MTWTLNSTYHGEQVDDDVRVSAECEESSAAQVLVHLKGLALLCVDGGGGEGGMCVDKRRRG